MSIDERVASTMAEMKKWVTNSSWCKSEDVYFDLKVNYRERPLGKVHSQICTSITHVFDEVNRPGYVTTCIRYITLDNIGQLNDLFDLGLSKQDLMYIKLSHPVQYSLQEDIILRGEWVKQARINVADLSYISSYADLVQLFFYAKTLKKGCLSKNISVY